MVPCGSRRHVSEPRAARLREITSSSARRQGDEQIGQGDVRVEALDEAGEAIASGAAATLAVDPDDGQGKSASEREPMRRKEVRSK